MGLTVGHTETLKQIKNDLRNKVKDFTPDDRKDYLENIAIKLALPNSDDLKKQVAADQAKLDALAKALGGNKVAANIFIDCDGMPEDDSKAYKVAAIKIITDLEAELSK